MPPSLHNLSHAPLPAPVWELFLVGNQYPDFHTRDVIGNTRLHKFSGSDVFCFWRQGKWKNPRNRWNVRRILDTLVQNTHLESSITRTRNSNIHVKLISSRINQCYHCVIHNTWKESAGRTKSLRNRRQISSRILMCTRDSKKRGEILSVNGEVP
jgi:hypothetical protein